MSSGYSYTSPLSPNWGFPEDPFRNAGETICPLRLQQILYENLGFERSNDSEVPMVLCERFCGSSTCSKDILAERFNQREEEYNNGRARPRDFKDILKNLCKIYSKLRFTLPPKAENEYIMLAFHDHLFIKGPPFC